ncbi:MAG: biosynthetic arginine decarboxylase [Gammaproteobacteria bacterium]|jgi:arginine decarboxylase
MTWTLDMARRRYNIAGWSDGYFDIGADGHLVVRPGGRAGAAEVDLYELAHQARAVGLSWPVLLRFTDILHQQVDRQCAAFRQAMDACDYDGDYTAVYPIKVNQQQHVVDAIVRHGGARVGLEAGSKPELMAVLGVSPPGGVIVCNGYKDSEYIRLALIAQRLGQRITLVIEKFSELELVAGVAATMKIRPRLGVRVRLAAVTSGNWQNSGGERSKFGFTASGLLRLLERLRTIGMTDCLQLLHCHPGSQISGIEALRHALQEVGRTWVELRQAGIPIDTVDVGGGLGVDYEGTASESPCSVNYDLPGYARTVVDVFTELGRAHGLPVPHLVTESGRALTAHHAVLITHVMDTEQVFCNIPNDHEPDAAPVAALRACLNDCTENTALAIYRKAGEILPALRSRYISGDLTLAQRARGESLYHALCSRVQGFLERQGEPAVELDEINRRLADKYFCNFSVFQSLPDVWGVDQVFPIMPLQQLDEAPQRRAILHDLTCDSDGQVEFSVDSAGVETSLPLHTVREDEPYLLGFFLVGAYQEILGDMHNLFGDTDAVNVELTADGDCRLVEPHHGDTVDELLRYVEFEPKRLLARYREKVAAAGLTGRERTACLQALEGALFGTTYLEEE